MSFMKKIGLCNIYFMILQKNNTASKLNLSSIKYFRRYSTSMKLSITQGLMSSKCICFSRKCEAINVFLITRHR